MKSLFRTRKHTRFSLFLSLSSHFICSYFISGFTMGSDCRATCTHEVHLRRNQHTKLYLLFFHSGRLWLRKQKKKPGLQSSQCGTMTCNKFQIHNTLKALCICWPLWASACDAYEWWSPGHINGKRLHDVTDYTTANASCRTWNMRFLSFALVFPFVWVLFSHRIIFKRRRYRDKEKERKRFFVFDVVVICHCHYYVQVNEASETKKKKIKLQDNVWSLCGRRNACEIGRCQKTVVQK